MVYIRTEDTKDGLVLVTKLIDIYFPSIQIDVQSFGGMKNLNSELELLFSICKDDDKIILIYDNIMENPLIVKWFRQAHNTINNSKFKHIISWLPTNSFELEILMIDNIQYFIKISKFIKYVLPIKRWYNESGDTSYLTVKTKDNCIYNEIYESIKKKKLKSSIYKELTDEEFERTITIESLSKVLLNECFNGQPIDKPMTECWRYDCCYRRNKCKSELIDTEEIINKQKDDSFYKVKLLINNTTYINVVKVLSNVTSINIEYKNYCINDILNIALSFKVKSLIEEEN